MNNLITIEERLADILCFVKKYYSADSALIVSNVLKDYRSTLNNAIINKETSAYKLKELK
jgi:hypothetical protein